jgi:hypothetical protein
LRTYRLEQKFSDVCIFQNVGQQKKSVYYDFAFLSIAYLRKDNKVCFILVFSLRKALAQSQWLSFFSSHNKYNFLYSLGQPKRTDSGGYVVVVVVGGWVVGGGVVGYRILFYFSALTKLNN